MSTQRWAQIEALFHGALALLAAERSAYVERSCGPDEALRNEVESLLAHDRSAGRFLGSNAMEVTARSLAEGRAR